MRTVSDDITVRLYHLDDEGGSASTLLYGTLGEALAAGLLEPPEVQAALFIQTANDVIAYLDLVEQ